MKEINNATTRGRDALVASLALLLSLFAGLSSLATPQKTTTLTVGGYAGTTTLANFPVLVRLSVARVDGFDPHDCAENGADVWFASNAAGTKPIPHEIERWDGSGESAIWVRIPELSSTDSQPTTFYMFWKDDAPPANETTNVWNGADYRAIWHMNEASTTQRDSTAIGLAATLPSSATYATGAGKAGLSLKLDSALTAKDFFLAANGGVATTHYSVSTWVYGPDLKGNTDYIPMKKGGWGTGSWFITWNTIGALAGIIYCKDLHRGEFTWPDIRSGWALFTLTYDGTNVRLYGNGSLLATHAKTLSTDTADFVMSVPGWYDETRVRNATSSDDWVKAEYDSVNNADFVTAAARAPNYIRVVGDTPLANERAMGYGVHEGLEIGREYTFSVPEYGTNTAASATYRCTGWTLALTNGTVVSSTAESPRRCTVEFAAGMEKATLTWQWTVIEYRLDTSVAGQGSVDVAPQFVTTNGSVTINATPSAGWKFWKWTGDCVTAANRYRPSMTLTVNAAKSVTAYFYDVAKAVPTNVYVSVNGAGDLSGRDEENAARNLTSAYAACAANPVGGTVHVAGGIYRSTAWSSTKGNFTENAALTPAPYVTLVGSSDTNNPTILTGDRDLDDKWDYNGASQWSNGKLVLPPLGVATLPRTGSDDSNFISSSERAEGCRFENLTIHGFTSTAVSMSYATNAVFANCRFIGIGNTDVHPSLRSLTIGQAPVVVTNCLFVGHVSALGFSSGANVTMTVMDSLIRSGVNGGAYSADSPPGIYNSANVTVKLVRTTVRDTQSGNPTMCAASGYWNCQDCSFINMYATGSSRCTFHANGGGTFAGCAFLTNRVSTSETGYYSSACVGGNGGFSFSDCYFGGNKLTKTNGASGSDGSVLSTEVYNTYTFVNCTAEDNCVTSTAGKAANACTVGGWRAQNFAIANCVFRNNSNIDATGTRRPEFRAIRTNSDTSNSPMFVNSIVRNPAESFVAFSYTKDSSEHRRFGVAACDIQGYVAPTAGATGNGFSYAPIVDVEPCLAAAARHEGPRGARPPTRKTPREVARGAVRLYKATNGCFYFLDTHVKPNQWRKIAIANDGGSKVSLADGLKIGLDPSKPAHPDVFGTRRRLRPAMGPADTPPIGAVLSLR